MPQSSPSTRRGFLATATAAAVGATIPHRLCAGPMPDVELGERPQQAANVQVLNPYGRVPVSFIIDDSTCLVNMGYYCIPQFKEAWGAKRYGQPWQTWPREIPDSFVREFAEFCKGEGVKGKYSIVPYPACVGWLDRDLPGWERSDLRASLKLVQETITPDWDIHPEMISHTRVIDISTGRPLPRREEGGYWMENGGWCAGRSLDEISNYIAYALTLIKNLDLPCEGFTTPGGFGNPAKQFLSQGGMQAIRSALGSEVPHYFKYVVTDIKDSTQPQVEQVKNLNTDAVECIVNIPSCTGDCLGTWDGGNPTPTAEAVDRLITADHKQGRLVDVIEKGEPACFLTHWPGMYANGTGVAFRTFQETVRRVNAGYRDRIRWMKLSEIARYWAAKELTSIKSGNGEVQLKAPFASPGFTLQLPRPAKTSPRITLAGDSTELKQVSSASQLTAGAWTPAPDDDNAVIVCFDLAKGVTTIA